MRNSILIALVVAILTILWPHNVHAQYIDPTTGGMLLQLIFGGVAGIAIALKLFRHRLTFLFSRLWPARRRSPVMRRDDEIVDSPSSKSDGA